MIRIHETTRSIPFFQPACLTVAPLIYHREHMIPDTTINEDNLARCGAYANLTFAGGRDTIINSIAGQGPCRTRAPV